MIRTLPQIERPILRPMPHSVEGIAQPVTLLNGTWKYAAGNIDELLFLNGNEPVWEDVPVPLDLATRKGVAPKSCAYLKNIYIPADYKDMRLFIRFEGAQGLCAVYVNGRKAGGHAGGYIDWDCEITDFVKPGETAVLVVSFTGGDDMGNAHGGLIRDVSMVARPFCHIVRLHSECTFDSAYNDASLSVFLGAEVCREPVTCRLTLAGPDGGHITISPNETILTQEVPDRILVIPVKSPLKWDAEHPNLYTLTAVLYGQDGRELETVVQRVGFRQIEIHGNIVLVNGVEVKLRGVCRHDFSPLHGHTVTREEIERDVLLFKEANCNHIRTSHYPPTRYFLDLCDEHGIYVEDEIGIAFIGRTLKYTQKAPDFAERYVRYFSEMIERDRSHPSVLIWSIANESFYGPNFALCNEYAHRECPAIPTKFSYPMTMQEEDAPVDIWSIHYANFDTDLGGKLDNVGVGGVQGRDRPILHDEFAHIPCYNRDEHKLDPAVRVFYGESIETFWNRIWNTKGALGGAIWAGIDLAAYSDEPGPQRLLEWGIIDGFRRAKPEHFGVRRAFSPVRLNSFEFTPDGLRVTVENRFCHTDMKEVAITWKQGEQSGEVAGFSLPVRGIGGFTIAADSSLPVFIRFTDPNGLCVEELELQAPAAHAPQPFSGAPDIRMDAETITLSGEDYSLVFSRTSGLILQGRAAGRPVITGGPYLNMVGVSLPDWSLSSITAEPLADRALVWIKGSYGDEAAVTFRLSVDKSGLIETKYTLDTLRIPLPWEMKIRVGVHTGGLNELGVYYTLSGEVNGLAWERDGQNAVWPSDHIARAHGIAARDNEGGSPAFAGKPSLPWGMDSKSYFLYGRYDPGMRGSNDFRSSKHCLYAASALIGQLPYLTAISDGAHSVRMELVPNPASLIPAADPAILYSGVWHEVRDKHNRFNQEIMSNEPGAFFELRFTGTGICWFAPVDTYYGTASVFIDGEPVDANVCLTVDGVEFPGSSMGFDKRYEKPVFSVCGLSQGTHTLRVAVKEGYVSADYFRVIGGFAPDEVKFIINNDYNYPKLAWGNLMRPAVLPKEGDTAAALMKIGRRI